MVKTEVSGRRTAEKALPYDDHTILLCLACAQFGYTPPGAAGAAGQRQTEMYWAPKGIAYMAEFDPFVRNGTGFKNKARTGAEVRYKVGTIRAALKDGEEELYKKFPVLSVSCRVGYARRQSQPCTILHVFIRQHHSV
jgi:hypothetical protein